MICLLQKTVDIQGRTAASLVALALCLLTSCAPKEWGPLPPDRLRDLACRIVAITGEPVKTVEPLIDANLDTVSGDPADQSFEAVIHNAGKLGARVRQVNVHLPRERFNVTMTLDGRTILRLNHVDLDIYVETTIDGRVYALHCFPEHAAADE